MIPFIDPAYSPVLLAFYGAAIAIVFTLLHLSTFDVLFSLIVSPLIILVGSEFWEAPIYLACWIGIYGHQPPLVWNAVSIALCIGLFVLARVKFDKRLGLYLFCSFVVLAVVTLPTCVHIPPPSVLRSVQILLGYVGRSIGIATVFLICLGHSERGFRFSHLG